MTKRKIAANTTAIIVLSVLTVILAITAIVQNRYINTQGGELNSAYAEISELEKEVAGKQKLVEEKSMQLIYKDDVYKQETMREEGVMYQNYWEGLDKE